MVATVVFGVQVLEVSPARFGVLFPVFIGCLAGDTLPPQYVGAKPVCERMFFGVLWMGKWIGFQGVVRAGQVNMNNNMLSDYVLVDNFAPRIEHAAFSALEFAGETCLWVGCVL